MKVRYRIEDYISERNKPREVYLDTFVRDTLSEVCYGSGKQETIEQRIDNVIDFCSKLVEFLCEKRVISGGDLENLLSTSDTILSLEE